MNHFLAELSSVIEPDRHVALVVDNAGWHTAKELIIPSNITLIPLPPYSPELNAMEQIWQWIKNHFLSNQCYKNYAAIVDQACHAWNELSKDIELVKSIMYREWTNS
jgi:transposase